MKIGLIGCGKMGLALLHGMLRAGVTDVGSVYVLDASPAAAEALLTQHPGLHVCASVTEMEPVDVVILAVKPKDMLLLLEKLVKVPGDRLYLSIAAGVTLAQLHGWLEEHPRIIRVMPNTPAQIGFGYAAFSRADGVTDADAETARRIFGAAGLVDEVPELLMDAITGLSGSGPAYIFTVIEALADGGVLMGLPRVTALRAAAQTVLGAAQMVIETGEHPAALRDAVTSPGGTTIAGLEQLEAQGLRNALMQAVRKATMRSRELAG